MSAPLVLFVSTNLPVRDYHGGCAYMTAIEEELHAAGVRALHIWLADVAGRRPFRLPRLEFVRKVYVPGALTVGRWVFPWSRLSADCRKLVSRVVKRTKPALAILDRASSMKHWSRGLPCAAWVLTIDVLHRRQALYQIHGYRADFEAASEGGEAEMLRSADGIIAIQEAEAAEFRRMAPGMHVVTVPHPIRPDPLPLELCVNGTLLIIGGSGAHNVDGLRWFVDDVLPLIQQQYPDIVLEVAGAVAESVPDHPAIRKLGHVRDLKEAYARAQVCLAPLRFGTGLKIKVVEAMGYGRPVVGTSVAAEGFDDLPAALAGVANDAFGLAASVVRLIRNPIEARAAVDRQLKWVANRLSPAFALRPVLEQLKHLP